MKIISFVITCLFLFGANLLVANQPAPMKIAEYSLSQNRTNIVLNNGTQWVYDGTNMFTIPGGWEKEDHIIIVYTFYDGYFLENITCQGCIPVKLANPLSSDIEAAQIQSITKNEKKGTNKIILDDGSQWFIGSWSSAWMDKWKEGDRVIVTPQEFTGFNNAENLIINLDNQLVNVRAQLLYAPDPINEEVVKRPGRSWPHSIVDITQDAKAALIQLENGIVLKAEDLKQNDKMWKVGDEIAFHSVSSNRFAISNMQSKKNADVTWTNHDLSFVEAVQIQEVSKDNKKIILDDGSIWFVNMCYEGSNTDWKISDRIVVLRKGDISFDTSSHVLFNLTQPSKHSTPSCWSVTLMR